MKIATIGAGNWGINIVRNLHDLGVLAAVADQAEGLRRRAEETCPGLRTVPDYRELLDADLDAVVVATPAETHHEIAKAFLEHGKDVLVEKPMTLTADDAGDLVAVAEGCGRVLMVGHLLLYDPAIRWLTDYLRRGEMGRVFSLHQERTKLGRARPVENVLWSLGVHDVAVLLHLAGEAPSEVRVTSHACLRTTVEDDAYLHLDFPSGLKGHLHSSWLWPEDRRSLTVIAEKGMLVLDEKTRKVTRYHKTIDAELRNCDEGQEVVFEDSGELLRLELEHFIDCVRTRATPISDGRNGQEVVRILEDACRAGNR
jgi:predicted dehydrogenase